MKKLLFLPLVGLVASCGMSQKELPDEPLVVERTLVYADASKGNMTYRSLFDSLSVIPLDTTNGFLVGEVEQMKISEDAIVVLDNNSEIHIFDGKGHGQAHISRRGQGRHEYIDVRSMDVVSDSIICLLAFPPKLMYFRMDGSFVSETPLRGRAFDVACLDDGSVLLFKDNMTDSEGNISLLEVYNPLDGTYRECVSGCRFMENRIFPRFQQKKSFTKSAGGDVLFVHSLSNNIYGADGGKVCVKYQVDFGDKNPSNHYPKKLPQNVSVVDYLTRHFPVYGFNNCWENDSYLCWGAYLSKEPVSFLYDKKEEKLYTDFYMGEDFTGLNPCIDRATDRYLAAYFTVGNIESLADYLDMSGRGNEKSPELERMVAYVRGQGNPIVGLYYFKHR